MGESMTLQEALRLRLSELKGTVLFSDLKAHLERDALFIVSQELDLVECGLAVANDDVAAVGAWIKESQLRKPTPAEREAWPRDTSRRWVAIVVQPFVLVQEVTD